MLDEIFKERAEFLTEMHGYVPNRVLLNQDDADELYKELEQTMRFNQYQSDLPVIKRVVLGMRVVIDPWADKPQVCFARESA